MATSSLAVFERPPTVQHSGREGYILNMYTTPTWRRRGLARLDYTQNAINKTLVAPFSTRPSPGAPVSVPIRWDELDDPDLRPDRWTIRTVIDRVHNVGDPLAPLIGRAQDLPTL